MAKNDILISASRAEVWAVLSDPDSYGHWVVGSAEIRSLEGRWPRAGAKFHHTQGIRKLGLKDTTSVLESDPEEKLVLRVRARPLVEANVSLELSNGEGSTKVTMREQPVGGLLGLVHNPLFDLGLRARNAESLRRLRDLAEHDRSPAPPSATDARSR